MMERLHDYAFTCDADRDGCNTTMIVERASSDLQARQVLVSRGWTMTLLNDEYCPVCWGSMLAETQSVTSLTKKED
jgi:hypothetical protein